MQNHHKKYRRAVLAGSFIASVMVVAAWAADGALDAGFGTAGVAKVEFTPPLTGLIQPTLRSAAVQADSSILLAGLAELCDEQGECGDLNNNPVYIARLNANGSANGAPLAVPAGENNRVFTSLATTGGKVLTFGQRTTVEALTGVRIARLSSAGAVEAAFDATPTAALQSSCNAGIVDSGGKIVAACVSGSEDTHFFMTVLRLNADLTPDAGFGNGGFVVIGQVPEGANGSEGSTIIQETGGSYLVVGGTEFPIEGSDPEDPQSVEKIIVARLSNIGVLDVSFGDGGIKLADDSLLESNAEALALDALGRIYVCGEGETETQSGFAFISRLTAAGATDETFNTTGTRIFGGLGTANNDFACRGVAVVEQKVYALGSGRLYRFNLNGVPEGTFNPVPTEAVALNGNCSNWGGLAVLDNNYALLVGGFDNAVCAATPKATTLPAAKVVLVTPPPDMTPNAFEFTDVTDAELSTPTTSDSITVTGVNGPTSIQIAGGSYSINNGPFKTTAGTVSNGDTVRVQLTSSAAKSTTLIAVLNIGGVTETFTVKTNDGKGGGGALSPFTLMLLLMAYFWRLRGTFQVKRNRLAR